MLSLKYDRGTITLSQEGEGRRSSDELLKFGSALPVWLKWDKDRCLYRALAYKYRELVGVLKKLGIGFSDEVMSPLECPKLSADVQLYDFQEDALDAWSKRRAGSLVIPTGGGKTIVAMRAIADLNASTLVIAPTLELVGQWSKRMGELFHIPIGKYTGDEKVLEPLTVATYDTAYLRAQELGDKFMLVVFDEAHHLAAPGYLQIAEMLAAPWRMGLTATYEREDKLHLKLDEILGGKVYEISLDALRGKHLSDFITKKIVVSLLPEEKREYDRLHSKYLNFLRSKGIRMRSPADFQRFVVLSGRDAEGREALLAKIRAREIAMNSMAKIHELGNILTRHRDDRTIIFTEYNDLVHRISNEFLIPGITHRTPKKERVGIFESFRNGEYGRIVTSKVLEEGIDVPEASVGVILSGSGSVREYRQRLGRILRRQKDKLAILYEIVSDDTIEVGTSYRRHRKKMR